MSTNPYQAPQSSVQSDVEKKPKRSIWWKVYFYVITFLSITGILSYLFHPDAGLAEYVIAVIWLGATTGLFCFTHSKKLLSPGFWQANFIIYLGFSVAFYFVTNIDMKEGLTEGEFWVSTIVAWIISLPEYWALFSLGRKSNPIWQYA